MARSTRIYVVKGDRGNNEVVGAFTVKHECQTWLTKQSATSRRLWEVESHPDGVYRDRPVYRMTVAEFLGE